MGQKVIPKLDRRILKSNISPYQNDILLVDRNSWTLKNDFKKIGVGLVKNKCDHRDPRTIRLAVSQEIINRTN